MRTANIIALIVFLGFAAVQWNDPDGLIWGLAYLLAAVIALFSALGVQQRFVGLTVACCFFFAAMRVAPSFGVNWMEAETGREAMGLALCAAWCIVVVVTQPRLKRKPLRFVDESVKRGVPHGMER